jgi:hypothetical protein
MMLTALVDKVPDVAATAVAGGGTTTTEWPALRSRWAAHPACPGHPGGQEGVASGAITAPLATTAKED